MEKAVQRLRQLDRQAIKNFFLVHAAAVISMAVGVLVVFVFVPQLSNLKDSLLALQDANIKMLALALGVFCLGFPVLALKYTRIVQFKLFYLLTLQVQIASAFVSKLLPMSIGSLTVNMFYLSHESKDTTSSAAAMALNATTGSIAFLLIIIVALMSSGGSHIKIAWQAPTVPWLGLLIGLILTGATIWLLHHFANIRRRIAEAIKSTWQSFRQYRDRPLQVVWAIVLNGLGSLTGIATLFLCCQAVGLPVSFPQVVLSYLLGNVIGSLVPTPGGLGGAETGLYAGLVFFGYDNNLALVAVLTYRLISYWIPILPGYLMYRHLHRTILADFHIRASA